MAKVRVQVSASLRIDEIYRYTRDHWGQEKADQYVTGLFEAFDKIETHGVISKPIPAVFGLDGYVFRYEKHFVYWRKLANGDIGIVTILHERMHLLDRLRNEFGL